MIGELNATVFDNLVNNAYWRGTEYDPDHAWFFNYGYQGNADLKEDDGNDLAGLARTRTPLRRKKAH